MPTDGRIELSTDKKKGISVQDAENLLSLGSVGHTQLEPIQALRSQTCGTRTSLIYLPTPSASRAKRFFDQTSPTSAIPTSFGGGLHSYGPSQSSPNRGGNSAQLHVDFQHRTVGQNNPIQSATLQALLRYKTASIANSRLINGVHCTKQTGGRGSEAPLPVTSVP